MYSFARALYSAAELTSNGVKRHLGMFVAKTEAAAAYIGALRALGGSAEVRAADEAQAELDEYEVRAAVESLVETVIAHAGGE